MHPAKRANWRKRDGQQSSPGRVGRGHGAGQIYANCCMIEASTPRSSVNYASPTISSSLKKTGQLQVMPDNKTFEVATPAENHETPLKKLLAAKLQAAEKSLEKSPTTSEDKEEEEEGVESQSVGEVIYMAEHASSGSDCPNDNAKFANALSPIFEEKEENDDNDFTNSTGSFSPPGHVVEEKTTAEDEENDDDDESFDGGEQVDGNLKEQSVVDGAVSKDGSEGEKDEANSKHASANQLTPKIPQQRLRQLKASKDGRIKELQEKVGQLEAKLKDLQEAKKEKKMGKMEKSKSPSPLEDSSPLPPLTTEQLRIIASDKCSSGASPSSPSSKPSSKATLVLDGVHHMPLPRDFNRMPSVKRDILLVALPEAVRASYLNMCWEARFFEQMTVAPMKAAQQELLLSLKL